MALLATRFVLLLAIGTAPLVTGGLTAVDAAPLTSGAISSGAKCDGKTDDTPAIQAAVNAAGRAPGGIVAISAGTCVLDGNIHLNTLYGVTVSGAGSARTFLVQHSRSNIFAITSAGNTVEAMNLDTATFNPGIQPVLHDPVPGVLYSSASDTTVTNVVAEAGSGFGMRLTGPNPCSAFPGSGDVVSNVTIVNHGTGGFAALDIDCQNGARVSNIEIHGGILALYNDEHTVLSGEVYYGVSRCQPAWFVTGPAHDILIENVRTHAGFGRIHGTTQHISISGQTRAPGVDC